MTERTTKVPALPRRDLQGHKGSFGSVLIIGGSGGMIGAPALAANAALRSGAGLVRIATAAGVQQSVAQLAPCATSIPLAQDEDGLIAAGAIHEILSSLDDNDCIAVGPGLGRSGDLRQILQQLISRCQKPMVIDADGLNNLAVSGGQVPHFTDSIVLTPHPGEMKRLWRAWFRGEQPGRRSETAEQLSQRCGAVVVLKGAGTVVSDGKRTYINETGNSGMATGGSGDVLTGCIAGLLANRSAGLETFDAAVLAVYVHGVAGDLAAKELTETAMIATDLIDFLANAWACVM